ncbi:hypothetical protein OUZ56_002312 [Daphnia magna]|uniref:Uncharacterized protein n=1 Tax=Daphnia magna TaxID=35525 RepID=A0ABR0A5B8_9CRUS|nr:hypothetical protein OUZ56_002312 [Daphnia magna]
MPGLSVSLNILNRTEPLENYLPMSQPIGHFSDNVHQGVLDFLPSEITILLIGYSPFNFISTFVRTQLGLNFKNRRSEARQEVHMLNDHRLSVFGHQMALKIIHIYRIEISSSRRNLLYGIFRVDVSCFPLMDSTLSEQKMTNEVLST